MPEPATRRPVLLDTDIGTDVDDILALVLLARAPELQLVGVTTVYGDTLLRARMTRHVLDLMGHPDVPIGIGASETLTGRTVWWAGHEGEGIPDLDRVRVDEGTYRDRSAPPGRNGAQGTPRSLRHWAVDERGRGDRGRRCLRGVPASSLHHGWAHSGWSSRAQHQMRSRSRRYRFPLGHPDDRSAAWMSRNAYGCERPNCPASVGRLMALVRCWRIRSGAGGRSGVRHENNLHDPLAILPAIRPELFRFEHCDVRVELGGAAPGRTRLDAVR